jgi:L-iditol 2-dehydrogenase
MRAVRVSGPGEVAVVDLPDPVARDGEVVVRVEAAGLCSTDRKFVAQDHEEPRVLGHEVAGRLPDGTLVGVHPEIVCGVCDACRAGWENRCPDRVSLGLGRDGGLAESVAVPEAQVLPLGDLDPVVGAMLEPLACAVHAIDIASVEDGSSAAVVGAGAMGVLSAWVLQARGCRVVAVQRSPERRRLALELGLDAAIGSDDDVAAALDGPPRTVVVAAPGAGPLAWALERVAVGGVVHAFAGTPDGAQVDANLVHYRHLRLVGSTGSRRSDHRTARDLVASGEVKLDRLPRRVVGLDEAPAAVLHRPPPTVLKTVVAVGDGVPTDD